MAIPAWVLVLVLTLFFLCSSHGSLVDSSTATLIRVDISGNGDYKNIQDAINAVPSNNPALVFIYITPGIYREKIIVPVDKPFIILSGSGINSTIITWNDSAAKNGGSTPESATFTVLATDFVGRYLTIENTYGHGSQAVSLRVAGERAAFYGCSIRSYQDTLLDETGRHYFKNCYIEGATDFICGNGLSLYESCHLHSTSTSNGAITAQSRSSSTENTAFSFVDCKITGVGPIFLGRAWGAFSRVIFATTYMAKVVLAEGWSDWNDPGKDRTVFYGQYKCYGPGSDVSGRVSWSYDLSDEIASPFLTIEMINGAEWIRPLPTHFKRFN